MTDQAYLTATRERTFAATVERALDDRVVLDRTLFYPEGGGQPADRGTLTVHSAADDTGDGDADTGGEDADIGDADADTGDASWRVTDVQKSDTVYHHLDGDPPAVGTRMVGGIDWERRAAHMRYHTAQHLLSAILLDEFDAPTRGNQLYADRARIDVAHDRFSESALDAIEGRMNDLAAAGHAVEWYTMDRETAEDELDPERTRLDLLPASITEIRIVEIEGFDRTACAGTHVATTDEIGTVEVTGRESRGAGEERVRFRLQ